MPAKLTSPPPIPPTEAPTINPSRRPARFINNEAGSVEVTVPSIIIAIGKVA